MAAPSESPSSGSSHLERIRVPAQAGQLAVVREFVLARAPAPLAPKVDLVLEELFLNVANYAYGGEAGDIEVACGHICAGGQGRFHLCLKDWGQPFDPMTAPPPDISAALEDRAVGGLGIHLVKEMTDSLEYSRQEDANRLDCCFFFDAAPSA